MSLKGSAYTMNYLPGMQILQNLPQPATSCVSTRRLRLPEVPGTIQTSTPRFQMLQRPATRNERFAVKLKVALVHNDGAGVHEGRHGRGQGRAPVLELMDGVVVHIVQEFQAVVAHHIGLLSDGARDGAAVDPIEGLRVVVEGHDGDFALHVEAMQRIGSAGASGGFQTDDAVDFLLLLN